MPLYVGPGGSRRPRRVHVNEGQLIPLRSLEKEQLKVSCTDENKIGQGHIGTVYKTRDEKTCKRFEMILAVKKVEGQSWRAAALINRTPRLLHPCLLPLLSAFDDDRIYYFITPYCAHGDLYTALKEKRDNPRNPRVKLNQVVRIRIIVQIAQALQYLHDARLNMRETVFHRNISSKKILLDERNNVRLIHEEITGHEEADRMRLYKPDDDSDRPPNFLDYFSFGVVIRELLTGADPIGKLDNLKRLDLQQIKGYADQDIWPLMEDYDSEEIFDKLNKIANLCLHGRTDLNFVKITEDLLDISTGEVMSHGDLPDNRCMLCVVNTEGSETTKTMRHRGLNCMESLMLCVTCEKNSCKNPVWCLHCGVMFEPLGTHWAALLVAGNNCDPRTANIFKQNVENMKQLISSVEPHGYIMGIREHFIQMIAPAVPGQEDVFKLILRVMEVMNLFRSRRFNNIDTLLIYYSGKSAPDGTTLQLGIADDDILLIDVLQYWLNELPHLQKVIVLADTYIYPLIDMPNKVIVQVTAGCGMDKALERTMAKGTYTGQRWTEGLAAGSDNLTDLKRAQTDTFHEGPAVIYRMHKAQDGDGYKMDELDIDIWAAGVNVPLNSSNESFSTCLMMALLSRCKELECRVCKETAEYGMNYVTGQSVLDFLKHHLPKESPRPVGYITGNATVGFYNKPMKHFDVAAQSLAAVLVAGDDREKPERAEVFKQDVMNMWLALTARDQSSYFTGLSPENVTAVIPNSSNIRDIGLCQQVYDAINKYNKPTVETLILYFSCRGDKEFEGKYLELDLYENLMADDLERFLSGLSHVKNIVLLVDQRCRPFVGLKSGAFAQLCACHSKKSTVYDSQGSRFTTYLRQGLRGQCADISCVYCKELKDSGVDAISASKLLEYVTNHLKKTDSRPFGYFTGNPNLAFRTDDEVPFTQASEE